MQRCFAAIAAAGLWMMAQPPKALSQRHEIPKLTSCIREFYDPEMYNYLTYKNTCTESLTVVFVAKDRSGVTGSMDLRPGAKDSVGKLNGTTAKVGGFELYVCPVGSTPVDDNNQAVTKPETAFHCQAKTQ